MITPFSAIHHKLISAVTACTCPCFVQRACHLAVVLVITGLLGCSPRYHDMPEYWPVPTKEYDNYGPGRFKTALLASQIDRFYRGSAPGPIGVATFVNIDDLYTSSTFGRMVGEQLMSELAMKGFDVVELRHADALQFIDSGGEFALSRDVRAVRPHRTLAAVVVGTYVVSPERVYVNARLVEPSTSLVLSAGSVEMSKTRELAKLLRGGSSPLSLERIPVKHLGYSNQPPSMEAMRRQWMMEEGGFGSLPQQLPTQQAAPQPPTLPQAPPPAGLSGDSAESRPTTPKVLEDIEPAAEVGAKPAIGLGR